MTTAQRSPRRSPRRSLLGLYTGALLLLGTTLPQQASPQAAPAATSPRAESLPDFAATVRRLSDAGGYFDTDNLISNEKGYQRVLGVMSRMGVRGGAYIGVGPDQNFTYIAQVRPRIALLVDVRRDNMLQHLMFKALFARARNRAEYLALWTGKAMPADIASYTDRSLESLVAWIDAQPFNQVSAQRARRIIREAVLTTGMVLSGPELQTIERFHTAFINDGLSLRFTSTGRAPQPHYPTLRQLLLERDETGALRNYLVREDDFQFLKSMQARNLIGPVTGDLGGPRTLPTIGRFLAERRDKVSVLYMSNVEDYLLRDGSFSTYLSGVKLLPRDARTVMIRSYFGGGFGHPAATQEYYATQLISTMDTFVADTALSRPMRYRELVNRHWLPLRQP
ncbi:MAG: hypothetical protein IT353_06440 [Gemmatimonadaceae bacterium]|nr:hypothetical protein [Gemmatimonadaceae bacterium]